MSAERALLVITDPAARSADGESVRVALDVLRAAAQAKVVIPTDAGELERALSRRGRRRVVVVAGEAGVHAVVRILEEHGELEETPIGVVPVDTGCGIAFASSLGLPQQTAQAARVALGDTVRPLDLLCDDAGVLALRSVRIGHGLRPGTAPARRVGLRARLERAARSMAGGLAVTPGHRLRVEADGQVLTDVDQPVLGVRLGCESTTGAEPTSEEPSPARTGQRPAAAQERSAGQDTRHDVGHGVGAATTDDATRGTFATGTASVVVTAHRRPAARMGLPAQRPAPDAADQAGGDRPSTGPRQGHHHRHAPMVAVRARQVTVCGTDFAYAADGLSAGAARLRTWTVRPAGWRLYLP